jgi:hypothetical protein
MYLACLSLLIFCILYGTWDRILIYVGFAWLARMFIGLQYVHFLILCAVLKRLRQMNQGLRQIGKLHFDIKESRLFVNWTIGCSVKIHHHLHKISEVTNASLSMVSNFYGIENPEILNTIFI